MRAIIEAPALFVYGTLRRTIGRGPQAALEQAAEYLGAATVPGRLYDLGSYPGAVILASGEPALASRVCGDLYRLRNESILETLDAYEGCALGQSPPGEYRRIRVEVTRPDGARCIAWCYHYQGETVGHRRIPGGDYVAYCRERLNADSRPVREAFAPQRAPVRSARCRRRGRKRGFAPS